MNDGSHSETAPLSDPKTVHFQLVPIAKIRPSPHQARKFFDEENLWKLAESLRQEGLIQPITVRRLLPIAGDREDPGFELVSGERRLRAARLLGWTEIEARVISVVSEGEVAAKGLIENLQREDLNPIEEAEGFAKLNRVDADYWTHERIAQVTGKSRAYITQSLGLLRLPEAIKEDVRRRTYTRGHALEIVRLPGSSLQLAVAKMVPDRMTREQTRRLVDSVLTGKKTLKMTTTLVRSDGKPGQKADDPLADFWPEFVMNPWIATPGTLKVKYLGDWRWSFEVPGPPVDASRTPLSELRAQVRAWFTRIFGRMSRSLEIEAGSPPPDATSLD